MKLTTPIFLIVFTLAFCAVTEAVDLSTINVTVEGADPATRVEVHYSSSSAEAIDDVAQVEIGAPFVLRLPGDRVWEFAAVADGYWAPPLSHFTRRNITESVRILLYPGGTIKGRVGVPKGVKGPDAIDIRFRPPPNVGIDAPPEGAVQCRISEGAFRCQVPQGRWDLRARGKKFVSHFFWDVTISAEGELDLGKLTLRSGGSVVGFVESDDPAARLADGVVELTVPSAGIQSDDSRSRSAGLSLTTRPDERGFFHFQGVRPGTYELVARHPKLARERVFPVQVMKDAESEITPALKLKPPALLEVRVEPPGDPWGRPWRVEVLDWRREAPIMPYAARGVAEGGLFRAEALPSGEYMVSVRDEERSRWASVPIKIDGGSTLVEIEVDLVPIEGTVRVGETELSADLAFTNHPETGNEVEQPLRTVRLVADEDGEFDGWLPEEGHYSVIVEGLHSPIRRKIKDVLVERRSGQRVARVEISLPDGRLSGIVVDAREKPVAIARVDVLSLVTKGDWATVHTTSEGTFEAMGLESGVYRVTAREGDLSSEPLEVSLRDDEPVTDLRLVLREQLELRGTVVDGVNGVPGARVEALTAERVIDTTTEIDGSFSLHIPGSDSRNVLLTVLAPGYALHLQPVVATKNGDPLAVRLTTAGGTLRLHRPQRNEGNNQPSSVVLLGANGVILDSTLDRWARLHGMPPVMFATEATIPAIEPGPYSACVITREEGLSLLAAARYDFVLAISSWVQANPDSCAEGFLQAGGELELDLPVR